MAHTAVSLSRAREKREAAKRLLAEGVDPAVQAKLDKIKKDTAASQTFNAIADEFLQKAEREGRADANGRRELFLRCLDRRRPAMPPEAGTSPAATPASSHTTA